MIANASSTREQHGTAIQSGILALVPPRHSELPVSILHPGRHFIGTDQDCHVRVVAEGVQSRHALIIVGDQKTLLKALDPRTWVNDHSVTETVLRPGERVSIGPITFAVRHALPSELQAEAPQKPDEGPRFEQIEIPAEIQTPPVPTEAKNESPLPANLTVLKAGYPVVIPYETISVTSNIEDSLQTIQKNLEEFAPLSASFLEAPISARASIEQQRLQARENELNQLADELASQSQQLNVRIQQLASREADLEQKQSQIADDNERLMKSTEEVQQRLSDECARQTSLWQEWDAAYQRSKTEIQSQFENLEKQREAIRTENQQLDKKREEIQLLQSEFENIQRTQAADKVQTAEGIAKLQAQWAAFETERHQHLTDLQEQETRNASGHRDLLIAQDELRAARQQFESRQVSFETEQLAEQQRREINSREQASLKHQLEEFESSLNVMKADLEAEKEAFDREKNELALEWSELESVRAEFISQQNDFEMKLKDSADASEFVQNAIHDVKLKDSALHEREVQLERREKELEAQRIDLEATRDSLQIDQLALEVSREEFTASTTASKLDSQSPSGSESATVGQKTNEWLPISDSVDHLLDTYSIGPSLSANFSETSSSLQFGQSFDFGIAPAPTPTAFSNDSSFAASESVGSYEPYRPDLDDSYALVQPNENEKFTSRFYGDSFPTVESVDEFDPASAAENSFPPQQIWDFQEQKSVDSSTRDMAEFRIPKADEALSDVNSRFGFLNSDFDQTGNSYNDGMPSDPLAALRDRINFNSSESETASSGHDVVEENQPAVDSDAEDPLLSLRARLAEMFEMENQKNSNSLSEVASLAKESFEIKELNDQSALEFDSHDEDQSLPIEPPELQEEFPSAQLQAVIPEVSQPASSSTPTSNSAAVSAADETEDEDDAWSRRLRELAAVAGQSHPSPAPVLKPETEAVAEQESQSTEEEDDEFSVEAQLARLLGKPLNKPSAPIPAASPKSSDKADQATDDVESGMTLDFESGADRSHLISEPKHKQDKNAVREEVQSFRAVAQMSARKALEKHSWNNFKSEFYFSSILLTVSLIAAAFYIGAFCYGIETTPWKPITCVLASILSGMKLMSLLSKLKGMQGTKAKAKSTKQQAS